MTNLGKDEEDIEELLNKSQGFKLKRFQYRKFHSFEVYM